MARHSHENRGDRRHDDRHVGMRGRGGQEQHAGIEHADRHAEWNKPVDPQEAQGERDNEAEAKEFVHSRSRSLWVWALSSGMPVHSRVHHRTYVFPKWSRLFERKHRQLLNEDVHIHARDDHHAKHVRACGAVRCHNRSLQLCDNQGEHDI